MPIALIVGPAIALIGIVAVVFVMRHKSVEKSSMYSARRSQIEHKVRAARQRTLAPQGRQQKAAQTAAEAMPPPPPPFESKEPQATYNYEPSAYAPPPMAAPEAAPTEMPSPFAWDVGPTTAPPPPPPSLEVPPPLESYPAAAEPSYAASPPVAEPVWTPAPAPSEPLPPAEPERPIAPSGGGASWEIVGAPAETAAPAEKAKDKKKKAKEEGVESGSWQLASGEAPGAEDDADEVRRPNAAMAIAIAQYAVLVVGLVMVLIGVLVMVANSHGA